MSPKLYEIVVIAREGSEPVGGIFWLTEDQLFYAGNVLKNAKDARKILDYRIVPTKTQSFGNLQKWFDRDFL